MDLLGRYGKFKVDRETQLGYIIKDSDECEYFLHHNECNRQSFKKGDILTAFIYADKKRRIAATCKTPTITLDKAGLCPVVEKTNAGCFVSCGLSKDLLLSADDLPPKLMPEIGDMVFCKMRIQKNNLYIKLLAKDALETLQDDFELKPKENVKGYVYRVTPDGVNFFDEHYNIIFVHKTRLDKDYRIGEKIEARIIAKEPDFKCEYKGTVVLDDFEILKQDKEKIMTYLKDNFGVMNYNDKTEPRIIEKVFKMSKLAFKKALGSLYKEKKIIFKDEKIVSRELFSWSNTIKK